MHTTPLVLIVLFVLAMEGAEFRRYWLKKEAKSPEERLPELV
jgi:hypothetical protein